MARRLLNLVTEVTISEAWQRDSVALEPCQASLPQHTPMKSPIYLLMLLCPLASSCDRHAMLQQEITVLESLIRYDQEAAIKYEKDIVALGADSALSQFEQQAVARRQKIRLLELDNAARERKQSAIATEFARFKPAAEAYKAAQQK